MFRGSFTALLTPFSKGKIDENAFRSFINWQIEQGTDGLVPCGTTGESPTLSHEEHQKVTEVCIEETAGRVPVIAGAGSNSTVEAVSLAKHDKDVGADAALVVTPYYNKPTQEGLYAHYKEISDQAKIPIIIYNIPGRSVIDMTVETMARLAKLSNIVGVKDATAELDRPILTKLAIGSDFCQLSGEDATALPFLVAGGNGCISVTSNIFPKLCSDMQRAWREGNIKEAVNIQDMLMPVHSALFCETSPGPAKYAAELMGLFSSDTRLPITKIDNSSKKLVKKCLQDLGISR